MAFFEWQSELLNAHYVDLQGEEKLICDPIGSAFYRKLNIFEQDIGRKKSWFIFA